MIHPSPQSFSHYTNHSQLLLAHNPFVGLREIIPEKEDGEGEEEGERDGEGEGEVEGDRR